jgi:WD40 repeat protein
VSVVAALGSNRGVSASYDATLRIWDMSGSQARPAATLVGHGSAVLTCCVDTDASSLLSGAVGTDAVP